MGKRIEYIDICKAVAIFSMVFCHVGQRMTIMDYDLFKQIHLWHMPLFFYVIGDDAELHKMAGMG